jgi:two-component system, NarL family, response regulator LiaR
VTSAALKRRVVVADDHPLVRQALQALLTAQQFEVVGETDSAGQVRELIAKHRPDLALLDLCLKDALVTSVLPMLRQDSPKTRIVVLTSFQNESNVQSVLACDVDGLLLKTMAPGALVSALQAVMGGIRVFDESVQSLVSQRHSSAELMAELTPRECDVLRGLAQGEKNHELAQRLGISENTVKGHVSHVLSKLDLEDRTQAAVWAWKLGWQALTKK